MFPRNKYMVLRLGQKDVLCEDVFESMVGTGLGTALGLVTLTAQGRLLTPHAYRRRGTPQLYALLTANVASGWVLPTATPPQVVFSEGWWVGTASENPEERRLPEPDWLAVPKLHEKYDFSGRGKLGAVARTAALRTWQRGPSVNFSVASAPRPRFPSKLRFASRINMLESVCQDRLQLPLHAPCVLMYLALRSQALQVVLWGPRRRSQLRRRTRRRSQPRRRVTLHGACMMRPVQMLGWPAGVGAAGKQAG